MICVRFILRRAWILCLRKERALAIYVNIQLNQFQVGWIDVRGRIHQVKKKRSCCCILLQLLYFSFFDLIKKKKSTS